MSRLIVNCNISDSKHVGEFRQRWCGVYLVHSGLDRLLPIRRGNIRRQQGWETGGKKYKYRAARKGWIKRFGGSGKDPKKKYQLVQNEKKNGMQNCVEQHYRVRLGSLSHAIAVVEPKTGEGRDATTCERGGHNGAKKDG